MAQRNAIIRGGLIIGGLLTSALAVWTHQALAADPAGFAGSAACKACHGKLYEAWTASPHGKQLLQATLPANRQGCEACHGAGSAHIASRGKQQPAVLSADDPAAANATCGACHFKSDTPGIPKAAQTLSAGTYAKNRHGRKGISCLACHSGHPTAHAHALRQPADALCQRCHADVLEEAPGKQAAYTHLPVAQGDCLTCHDPHGTPNGRMVVKDVDNTCRECHDPSDAALVTAHKQFPLEKAECTTCHDPHGHTKGGKLLKAQQHAPFKAGKCSVCHTTPAAGQPIGLVKPAKELCVSCHPMSKLVPQGEKAHTPVANGMCLTCHDPHLSAEQGLLKTRQANACFTCHKKVEDETIKPHRHQVLDDTMNCGLCHDPHSSAQPDLLVKDQQALCGQCHKHSFSHPMVKKADGTPVINPMTKQPLECSGCHNIHGSDQAAMTIADKKQALCLKCHTVEH